MCLKNIYICEGHRLYTLQGRWMRAGGGGVRDHFSVIFGCCGRGVISGGKGDLAAWFCFVFIPGCLVLPQGDFDI